MMEGRAASGKRVRKKRDPYSWATSIPPKRTNVLCLGMSYPCVRSMLRAAELSSSLQLLHPKECVEQAVELVRRNILTEMDGRDLARCLALEEPNLTFAYTVSMETGAIYGQRHLKANFNRRCFCREIKKVWGDKIKFRQIILDYFWIPPGSWAMTHWGRTFFNTSLPGFVTENLFDMESGEGAVYLPFCLHCVGQVVASIDILSKYYTISFLYKHELHEHSLWLATSTISPHAMQSWLGKGIDQEEIYCTFSLRNVLNDIDDEHVRKEDLLKILKGIENFDMVRMIKLQARPPAEKGKENDTYAGGFIGLKNPNEVIRGIDCGSKRSLAYKRKRSMEETSKLKGKKGKGAIPSHGPIITHESKPRKRRHITDKLHQKPVPITDESSSNSYESELDGQPCKGIPNDCITLTNFAVGPPKKRGGKNSITSVESGRKNKLAEKNGKPSGRKRGRPRKIRPEVNNEKSCHESPKKNDVSCAKTASEKISDKSNISCAETKIEIVTEVETRIEERTSRRNICKGIDNGKGIDNESLHLLLVPHSAATISPRKCENDQKNAEKKDMIVSESASSPSHTSTGLTEIDEKVINKEELGRQNGNSQSYELKTRLKCDTSSSNAERRGAEQLTVMTGQGILSSNSKNSLINSDFSIVGGCRLSKCDQDVSLETVQASLEKGRNEQIKPELYVKGDATDNKDMSSCFISTILKDIFDQVNCYILNTNRDKKEVDLFSVTAFEKENEQKSFLPREQLKQFSDKNKPEPNELNDVVGDMKNKETTKVKNLDALVKNNVDHEFLDQFQAKNSEKNFAPLRSNIFDEENDLVDVITFDDDDTTVRHTSKLNDDNQVMTNKTANKAKDKCYDVDVEHMKLFPNSDGADIGDQEMNRGNPNTEAPGTDGEKASVVTEREDSFGLDINDVNLKTNKKTEQIRETQKEISEEKNVKKEKGISVSNNRTNCFGSAAHVENTENDLAALLLNLSKSPSKCSEMSQKCDFTSSKGNVIDLKDVYNHDSGPRNTKDDGRCSEGEQSNILQEEETRFNEALGVDLHLAQSEDDGIISIGTAKRWKCPTGSVPLKKRLKNSVRSKLLSPARSKPSDSKEATRSLSAGSHILQGRERETEMLTSQKNVLIGQARHLGIPYEDGQNVASTPVHNTADNFALYNDLLASAYLKSITPHSTDWAHGLLFKRLSAHSVPCQDTARMQLLRTIHEREVEKNALTNLLIQRHLEMKREILQNNIRLTVRHFMSLYPALNSDYATQYSAHMNNLFSLNQDPDIFSTLSESNQNTTPFSSLTNPFLRRL